MRIAANHELSAGDEWMLIVPLDDSAKASRICGQKIGAIVLCLHCGRFHRIGHYRKAGYYELCPYDGCDGGPFDFSKCSPIGEHEVVLGRYYDFQKTERELFEEI